MSTCEKSSGRIWYALQSWSTPLKEIKYFLSGFKSFAEEAIRTSSERQFPMDRADQSSVGKFENWCSVCADEPPTSGGFEIRRTRSPYWYSSQDDSIAFWHFCRSVVDATNFTWTLIKIKVNNRRKTLQPNFAFTKLKHFCAFNSKTALMLYFN